MARRALYILLIALLAPQVIFAADGPAESPDPTVRLLVGRSTVVDTGKPIARVSLTSADIADAMVTAPNELLINGKTPGTISMFVWDRGGVLKRYEVTVQRDVARLTDQVRQLFPGEKILVESNGKNIVLSGSVSTKDISEKALSLAGGYVDKKDEVINLMQIAEGGASNQVLLRVRFAEVSRNAMTELGASFFTGAGGYKDYIGRASTQQFPSPAFDTSDPNNPKLVFSDFLNFFLFNTKHQLGTVIKALQTRGLFQSLAEPNLVAESGKEASFLAGGEFPIPIAQPSGGGTAITIVFKEFGIRLNFTPTVNGNRVHLKVRPEVSSLDFNNAIVLQGFRIPALTTRRTETELELEDHQTFAIAGLLNNTVVSSMQKIPGIGDIPILGLLFKSKAAQKDSTELVVMITPEILRNNSVGVTNQLPRLPEPFITPLPDKRTTPMPAPAFVPPAGALAPTAPTAPAATAPAAPSTMPPSSAGSSPAAAAAAVSALTPRGPQIVTSQPQAAPAAAAASVAAPAAAAPAPTRPLTAEEKKVLERVRQQEEKQRRADAEAQAREAKRVVKVQEADRQAAVEQKAHEEKLAKEQARLAKEQAKKDAEAQKRAAEEEKRQAERDKKQQKQIAEAEAKLKAAEAAYQAELAKKQKP